MITQIRFEGFKRLRDATVPLGPFQVLVGDNGVGKSTVLEGLELLTGLAGPLWEELRAAGLAPGHILNGRHAFRRLASLPDAQELRLTLGFLIDQSERTDFAFRANLVGQDTKLQARSGVYERKNDAGWLDIAQTGYEPIIQRFAGLRRLGIGQTLRLRLDPVAITSPSAAAAGEPRMLPTGEGLPTVLNHLLAQRDGTVEEIERAFGLLVPGVRRIRTVPASVTVGDHVPVSVDGESYVHRRTREIGGHSLEVAIDGLGWVPGDQLSEGTRLVLALLVAVHHTKARLLLLDDIEAGLHPRAQAALVSMLKQLVADRASTDRPLQVVATSHSPFVLDGLDAPEVLVVGATGPGTSAVQSLASHRDWGRLKGQLQPGEFWSFVGEGWVGEEVP